MRSTELCEPILHPCDVVPPTKIDFLEHQRIGEGQGRVRFFIHQKGSVSGALESLKGLSGKYANVSQESPLN